MILIHLKFNFFLNSKKFYNEVTIQIYFFPLVFVKNKGEFFWEYY